MFEMLCHLYLDFNLTFFFSFTDATSCMSSLRASPVDFLFGNVSSEAMDLAGSSVQPSFSLPLNAGSSSLKMVSSKLAYHSFILCLEIEEYYVIEIVR